MTTFLGHFSLKKLYNIALSVLCSGTSAQMNSLAGVYNQLKTELADLSVQFNPILRGWQNYYTRFYGSAVSPVWQHVNYYLVHWMMRKYKQLKGHKTRACRTLRLLAKEKPNLFAHWKAGYTSTAG